MALTYPITPAQLLGMIQALQRGGDTKVLTDMLDMAVPMWAGGMAGLAEAQDSEALQRLAAYITANGEFLLARYQPPQTAKVFNAVAEALARLSFTPGGVRCWGYRYTAVPTTLGDTKGWWATVEPAPDADLPPVPVSWGKPA